MTRSSDFERRNSTACSFFSTPAEGLAVPFMIWERWEGLTPARRATSFWLMP